MFFRFVCALILAALVSMTGIVLEKQTLERKRDVSRQYYQLDLLLELHAQSRLRIQRLTSPSDRIAQRQTLWSERKDDSFAIERYLVTEATAQPPSDSNPVTQPRRGGRQSASGSLPLLRWQQPVSADQVDPNRR